MNSIVCCSYLSVLLDIICVYLYLHFNLEINVKSYRKQAAYDQIYFCLTKSVFYDTPRLEAAKYECSSHFVRFFVVFAAQALK